MLPVTLTIAGAAALINFWLFIRIGRVRSREKIFVGDGGSEPLIRRMRAQANFIEFAPLVLILLALVEMAVGASIWLWLAGGAFILGRLAHAIGMDRNMTARAIGTLVSVLVLLGLAITALVLPYVMPSPITVEEGMIAEPLG